MTLPLTIGKIGWLWRLSIAFVLLLSLPLLLIRALVNPWVLTNNFIESSLNNDSALLFCGPSLLILHEIELFAHRFDKSQVLAILGEPRFKERNLIFPGCAPELTQADEVWFYEIAPHILFFLCFKGDQCTAARQFKGEEDSGYAKWKEQQIQKFGIGQTPEELERWLGCCFDDSPQFLSQFLAVIGNKSMDKARFSEPIGYFYISGACVIGLEMKNGRLAKAGQLIIFY